MTSALTISGLDCFYGEVQVLHGLNLELRKGEVLCLLGRNGAGKTTTLKAIMGLAPARSGSIMLDGHDLTKLAVHEVPRAGVAYVPQGRRLFAEMTVAENIEIGLMTRGKEAPFARPSSTSSPFCANACASVPAPCPAASSRCWPWPGRSALSPKCCCSTSLPKG